ncbi:ABC transporter permease [Synechococcus sp. PCC 7502]|uniref:ABC transporter permease n=1 Tax=Synechococcus sp. PCC 7502 TaxID=1173263 RepID=UPI0002F59BE4
MGRFWEQNRNLMAFGVFIVSFCLIAGFWELGAKLQIFSPLMPSASQTGADFWQWISDPFYDRGSNDKGIGWQLLASLRRVLTGFAIGSAIAIPLGIIIGLSEVLSKAIDPYIQLLKPVSPLAWLPFL